MKKSQKYYRIAFFVGAALLPFIVLLDRDMMRQWWFVVPLVLTMVVMFGFTIMGAHLEQRGE